MNNPPAFPQPDASDENCELSGMTLRDYFAAAAMQQFIREYFRFNGASFADDHAFFNVPIHAFRMADAMLKARDTKSPQPQSIDVPGDIPSVYT